MLTHLFLIFILKTVWEHRHNFGSTLTFHVFDCFLKTLMLIFWLWSFWGKSFAAVGWKHALFKKSRKLMKEENKIDLSMALEVHLPIFRHIILKTQHIFTGRQISIHFDLNICLTPFQCFLSSSLLTFSFFLLPKLSSFVPKGESKPALVHHSPNPDSRAVMYVLNSPQSIVLLLCILYFHNIKKKVHNNVKKASL